MATQPEISRPRVSGVASCRWVADFDNIAEGNGFIVQGLLQHVELRDQLLPQGIIAATCIAVGNTSLELWLLLTSSLG